MNSRNGKRFPERNGGLILELLIVGMLAACMQQDPLGPPIDGPDTMELEDPALLAGASSSTNWPVKHGVDTPITLSGKADSNLVLHFLQLDKDFQQQPKVASGSISLMPGTAIPALNPVRAVHLNFYQNSTVHVPQGLLDSLTSEDTVRFTLLIEVDTLQCLLVGFEFSKSAKRFLRSPFSAIPATSIQMEGRNFYFQGDFDTSVLPRIIPGHESAEMSFYIPGTTLHWKTRLENLLSIGPLPSGNYPLQLIVVKSTGPGPKSSQVEIFEVLLRRETITAPWRFSIGRKLLVKDVQGPVSLLSPSH